MDPRISLFLTKKENEGYLNIENTSNNPLQNQQQTLIYNTKDILDGCYIITTTLLYEISEDDRYLYTVTAGNKMFVQSKNYSQNFKMLLSPGYNLFINIDFDFSSITSLSNEIFGKIKKKLSGPNYFYQDVNSRLWFFLYDKNNRLNILSLLNRIKIISEVNFSNVFPNYNYLTSGNSDSLSKEDSIKNELFSLSKSKRTLLLKFLKDRGLDEYFFFKSIIEQNQENK